MDSEPKPSPELADCLHRLSDIVKQLLKVNDGLISVCVKHEFARQVRKEETQLPDTVAQVLSLLLQAVGSSTYTIIGLSDSPGLQTRDCYSIARSVVEAAVNSCYIMAVGEEAAARAIRHARQKAYRDLERESRIGESIIRVIFTGKPDPFMIEGLEATLLEFSTKSGWEKNGWIDLGVDDLIKTTGEAFGEGVTTNLHFARFNVYRHASEILHGTYFGALFFFGRTEPSGKPHSLQSTIESISQQNMLILLSMITSLLAIIEAFHRAYGFASAYERSNKILDSIHEIPYFKR